MQAIRDLTVLDLDHAMRTAAYAAEASFDGMALLVTLPAGGSTVYETLDPLVGYVLHSPDWGGIVKAMYGGRDPQGTVVFLLANPPPAPSGT